MVLVMVLVVVICWFVILACGSAQWSSKGAGVTLSAFIPVFGAIGSSLEE
jgi:hypothetical protein